MKVKCPCCKQSYELSDKDIRDIGTQDLECACKASQRLLSLAKKAVETAIEEDDEAAIRFLKEVDFNACAPSCVVHSP